MQNETDKLMKDLRLVAQDAEDLIRATAGEMSELYRNLRCQGQQPPKHDSRIRPST